MDYHARNKRTLVPSLQSKFANTCFVLGFTHDGRLWAFRDTPSVQRSPDA